MPFQRHYFHYFLIGLKRFFLFFLIINIGWITSCQNHSSNERKINSEPEKTVQQLNYYLYRDDWVGFTKAALPAKDYQQLQIAWKNGHSQWPLTLLPLHQQLFPLLNSLSAPDAKQTLQAAFNTQILGQDAYIPETAKQISYFLIQHFASQEDIKKETRVHYIQVIKALTEWAGQAPIGDPARAKQTILLLTRAAQETDIDAAEDFQELGMEKSLQQLQPFFMELKKTTAMYGLSVHDSFNSIQTQLLEQKENTAKVEITYQFTGKTIKTSVDLIKENNHWYIQDYLDEVRRSNQRKMTNESPKF